MRKWSKYLTIFLGVILAVSPVSVFSQPIDAPPPEDVKGGNWTLVPEECLGPNAANVDSNGVPVCGFPEFLQLIANVMGLLMVIALSLSALLFAIAGFRYVTAAGNTTQVEGAKKMFFNVAIGLVVVFAAYLIVQVIASTLQVDSDFNQFLEEVD